MRKDCVERTIKSLVPGSFLEVGAGLGDFTEMLLDKGFYGKCNDLGETTVEHLRSRFSSRSSEMQVISKLDSIQNERFDYLFTFEVLEHVENDSEAINTWVHFLKPGGTAVISVPAHQRKFSMEDEVVGHVRRYEKNQLENLMRQAGLQNIRIRNYGFPLASLTRRVSMLLAKTEKNRLQLSKEERSIQSGVKRYHLVSSLSFIANHTILSPFLKIQPLFFDKDWGDGYVAIGTKT
jgi:SAM-dependent methyltransferase